MSKKKYCRECGEKALVSAKFCSECGNNFKERPIREIQSTKLAQERGPTKTRKIIKHCKECGAALHTKSGFCPECGNPSSKAKQSKGVTKNVEFAVSGMVCHSCESIVGRALSKLEGVIDSKVSYVDNVADVLFNPKKISEEDILLTIKEKGYKAQVIDFAYRKKERKKNIIVIGILAVLVYIIVTFSRSIAADPALLSGASLGVVFVFGLITGFHCLGMCGGFVISYSTKLAQKRYNPFPHLAYNIGRTITYAFLGMVVGFLGSLVTISYSTQGILIILSSFIMVLLGLNLMGVLTVFRGFKLGRMKNPLGALVARASQGNRGPFILGLLNGFVPCGMVYIILFTYVPLSGGAIAGALAMAVFGVGTIPLMFVYGSALEKLSRLLSKNFVRYSGLIVIILALVMFNRGTVLAAIPETPEMDAGIQQQYQLLKPGEYQEITMRIDGIEFKPNTFTVEAGKPVKWTIIGEHVNGCSNEVIQGDWNIDVPIETGETKSVWFTPEEPGSYEFSCWMAMIFGEINVV